MLRVPRMVALLIGCPLPSLSAQAQQGDPATEWIRANAIRLSTPEAGHGFTDMQPLKRVIGNARIVSLGEATHGTREFFQLKHRPPAPSPWTPAHTRWPRLPAGRCASADTSRRME